MESLEMNSDFWLNRSVFLTGHTGFKGGWIALWLNNLGAKVHGYSLAPPERPNFFNEANLKEHLSSSTFSDICDLDKLTVTMKKAKPSVIIHMAAQPLVRESYISPVETFTTNVLGTVNMMEAARRVDTVQAIVNITTDKCYENREWLWPYRENDRLGGYDPYSSSKACAEIAAEAYRKSFLTEAKIYLASARAGNVIGGGDWASDRLMPDCLRAIDLGTPLLVRSPNSVRPWQHVLEPISGYLMLAEYLVNEGAEFAEAWNFGPEEHDVRPVSWILEQLKRNFGYMRWEIDVKDSPHEANSLRLDSTKSKAKLNWASRWSLGTAIDKTVGWHEALEIEPVDGSSINRPNKSL